MSARRVLILSASMGAGHDGAARELAARLTAHGHVVTVRDYLPMLPLRAGFLIRWIYGMQLRHAPSSYEWHYSRCERRGPVLVVSLWFARLPRRRVRRMVRREEADLVISTYPLASQVLGTLRAEGRLRTPTATYLSDFAPHYLWVHPHVDLHLTVSGPTARAATMMSGRPAVAAGPLVPDRFWNHDEADRHEVRARVRTELGLRPAEIVALTVAGSWGVGDVRTTVQRLAAGGRVRPVVVCGRNEALRAELATVPGTVALGWRTDMPDLMRAADVLVENAGGLTAMEAFASGLPVVTHQALAGHGRDNARAMAAQGVVRWVTEAADLVPTVVALSGRAGRAQAERARAVFAADPARVVARLAETGSVAEAVAVAGSVVPTRPWPLAPSSRRARRRRRTVLASVTTGMTLFASTAGVATATALGMGVSTGQTHHPGSVYLVVRPSLADLGADGSVSPTFVSALRTSAATVAADQRLLRNRAAALRTLAAAGLTVANAGAGHGAALDPRSSSRDLVSSRHELAALPGSTPWVFVACRGLTALDLTTSFVADEVIVRPDTALADVAPRGTPRVTLRGGTVVLLDARRLAAGRATERLRAVAEAASREHLALEPLRQTLAAPR